MKTIPLTQGHVAIIDDSDYENVNQWKWSSYICKNGSVYAARGNYFNGKIKRIKLHEQLMGFKKGFTIDHKNGNTLDYRRSNLRWATFSEQMMNRRGWKKARSKYKGVSRHYKRKEHFADTWQAEIQKNKVKYYIGTFKTEIEAAQAYDIEAKKLHGEFAKLNFPNQ